MGDFRAARTAMVDGQVRPSDVTSLPIIEAMLAVPREKFVPTSKRPVAYAGEDIAIGEGRALLAPRTFAKMLDVAEIRPGDAVLDIGCGLGYSAAVIAHLCASVVAIEDKADFIEQAEAALSAIGIDNVAVVEAQLDAGLPGHGPYDVILIEGGVQHVPEAMFGQLSEGGRLVAIHSRGESGQVRVALKSGGRVTERWAFDATAPLLPGFRAAPAFSL